MDEREGRSIDELRRVVRRRLDEGDDLLGEAGARKLFAGRLPFGPAISCQEDEEVSAAGTELGYPVVLKALSDEVTHKSEHALVRVGCEDEQQLLLAASQLREAMCRAAPEASFELSVQKQLSGTELAIGVRRDALGAAVVVSSGGVLIEVMRDFAIEMVPVDESIARRMLRRLRVWPVLDGYRGAPGIDLAAFARLVVAVSELADAVPELLELDLNPVFADPGGCAIADARCRFGDVVEEASSPRREEAMRSMFAPTRIAIVGASDDPTKVGGLALSYLRRHGWDGDIVAINPKPLTTDGVRTYPSIAAVDVPVDLAILAVPAGTVESVVKECVEAKIPAGVIFTSGFAEVGDEGRRTQERLVELGRAGGFSFIGPNTIGLASPLSGMVAAFGMALAGDSAPGSVGFVSQSGAIASSLISRAGEFGVGFSHWVSVGNEADLSMVEFVEYLAGDEATDVICLFVEAIRRPRAFQRACEVARAANKPIVALKAGRSEAGRAAAVSHTGAMTGSALLYDAYLRRVGAIQVKDLPAMLTAAQALQSVGAVKGDRMAIVSMSGGACSLLADACAEHGLEVPELSAEVQARLREVLPEFGGVRNPIDVTATGIRNPDLVRRTMKVLRDAGEVDLILLQLSTNADPAAATMAADLVALRAEPGTPFLLGRLGSPKLAPRAMAVYAEAGMHVFSWPGQLVEAADACVQFGRSRTPDER